MIIGIDTLRSDFLSSYGFPKPISPNIDSLASEGAVFTDAVSTAPWTLPAFASMLSGELPSVHGAGRRTGAQRAGGEPPKAGLRPGIPLIQERLGAEGWKTALFHDNPYLGPPWGLDRGFDDVQRARGDGRLSVDRALAWMTAHATQRLFVFLHLMEPHAPYSPPPPHAASASSWLSSRAAIAGRGPLREIARSPELRRRMAAYAGEVAYADELVGRFVDGLRRMELLDDTLLILTSDHGEEFREHLSMQERHYDDPRGIWGVGHGHTLYQELLSIPLVVRFPGRVPAGTVVHALVQLHDVFSTILDWVGLEPLGRTASVSLASVIGGARSRRPRALSEFILYGDDRAALRRGGWKLIAGPPGGMVELYDLDDDPLEARNLHETRPARTTRMLDELRRFQAANQRRAETLSAKEEDSEQSIALDDDLLRELRALGYVQPP